MAWRRDELYRARGLFASRGLSSEQLEDVYQETTLALMQRPYFDEEHLRSALRWGLTHRALRLYRDEHRHTGIIERHARESEAAVASSEHDANPETLTQAREDRLVVAEFLTELSEQERRVFSLMMAEGMSYWAIATAHGSTVGEARKLMRSCKQKLERWQLLYDTGRLCGYRQETIQAILDGQGTSEELANRAIAHVERCAYCRAEHNTNARKLRRAFKGQAAGLLAPTLLTKAGWLTRLAVRGRMLQSRLPGAEHLSAIREQAGALLTSGGIGGQLARGATAAAVLAAGTIGATHALQPTPPHHPARHPQTTTPQPPVAAGRVSSPPTYGAPAQQSSIPAGQLLTPGHVVALPHRSTPRASESRAEPDGFAYLGIPAPPPKRAPTPAQPDQRGGGPFGP